MQLPIVHAKNKAYYQYILFTTYMPIHEITTREFECIRCHYRWVSRKNGRDGPIPPRCANKDCKSKSWNEGESGKISPLERGLRRRLKRAIGVNIRERDIGIFMPDSILETFLSVKPKPTKEELKEVLYPLRYNPRDRPYYIPHPDPNRLGGLFIDLTVDRTFYIPSPNNPKRFIVDPARLDENGELKRNIDCDYYKLLRKEANMRIEIMSNIIRDRLIGDYDIWPTVEEMKEDYYENNPKRLEQCRKEIEELGDKFMASIPKETLDKFEEKLRIEAENKKLKIHNNRSNAAKKTWAVRHSS